MKKWIKSHKGLTGIFILSLVLLIIMIIIVIDLLIGNSRSKYGNRLDGIENVEIQKETYDGVEAEVNDTGLVEKIEIRLQGKIVYTTIVLKADTSVSKAKEIASNTLDNYSKEQLEFYDFGYFLKWEGEEADTVIAGTKHHNLDTITWIKS